MWSCVFLNAVKSLFILVNFLFYTSLFLLLNAIVFFYASFFGLMKLVSLTNWMLLGLKCSYILDGSQSVAWRAWLYFLMGIDGCWCCWFLGYLTSILSFLGGENCILGIHLSYFLILYAALLVVYPAEMLSFWAWPCFLSIFKGIFYFMYFDEGEFIPLKWATFCWS